MDKKQFFTSAHARQWVTFPLFRMAQDGAGGFRCLCGKEKGCSLGKHPRERWTEKHSPDPLHKTLSDFWVDADPALLGDNPPAGGGVHIGPSGLIVLDNDPRNGGDATLTALFADQGIPDTFTVQTGGGGQHFYFLAPWWLVDAVHGFLSPGNFNNGKTKVDLGPGVEAFAGRHYVVAPFSPHKSGGVYTITNETPPAELPEWLEDKILAALAEVMNKRRKPAAGLGVALGAVNRPTDFAWDRIAKRAAAYLAKLPPAIEGQNGSRATAHAACVLIQGFGLSPGEAFPLLLDWNATCRPPWSDEEIFRKLQWADAQEGERGVLLDRDTRAPRTAAEIQRQAEEIWAKVKQEPVPVQVVQYLDDGASAAPATDNHLAYEAAYADPVDSPGYVRPCCPQQRGVIYRHKAAAYTRLCWFDCKTVKCPHCGAVKRRQIQATITHHTQEAKNAYGDVLYVYFCSPGRQWAAVRRHILRSLGDYARLTIDSENLLLVVSTDKPPASQVAQCDTVTSEEAARRFCRAIERVPMREKLYSSSRRWKLLEDKKTNDWTDWRKVSKFATTKQTVLTILEHHGLDWKAIVAAGRWWSWNAWEVPDKLGLDWDRVAFDIQCGEVMPAFIHEEDALADVKRDDWTEPATTGPPGRPPGEFWFQRN